jgi:hypothetical protein
VKDTVFIVSEPEDVHADAVITKLNERKVKVFRFHPEEFPAGGSITIGVDGPLTAEIMMPHRRLRSPDVMSAWLRRPRPVKAPVGTEASLARYIELQTNLTIHTVYEAIPQQRWVCSPRALHLAELKGLQLARAKAAGLEVPRTIITNDPAQAKAFRETFDPPRCAVKPLRAENVAHPGTQGRALTLTRVWDGDVADGSIAAAPLCVQEYIEKQSDWRVTVIGDRIFPVRMHTQELEGSRVDSRGVDPATIRHEPMALPPAVEAGIRALLGSFGIRFAAIDLLERPDGSLVFIDLNPNGQWLWIEHVTKLPLVDAMVELLTTPIS